MKIAAAFATFLVCAAASSAQAETYNQLLDKSAKAMRSADWRGGLRHARALLDLPDLGRDERGAGLAHLCIHLTQLGQADEAQAACNETIARRALVEAVVILAGLSPSSAQLRKAEQILAEQVLGEP
jgi:hypothetical protein